jgi:hypothetical protein
MRIRSIAVRNYRVHRELKLDLDPARTLITGPNESGKSTLIEAVHRAFFLRARTGGEMQKSMVSRLHPGYPEVEVCFEAAGKVHRILKRFSGANGTTTLTELNGEMWSGEHAESRLARLLGVEPGGGKGEVATQWAHLWIWQGRAADDPTEHVNRECAALLARLQHEGGAALMQSEGDARVAEHFTRKHDEIFNRNGEPRAPSPLARALLDEACARKAHADAEETLRRLRDAAEEMRAADATISECETTVKRLAEDEAKINERVARVQALRRAEESAMFARTAAVEKEEVFARTEERLCALQSELATRKQAFVPNAEEGSRLIQIESDCRVANVAAEEAYQRAIATLREIRTRHDFVSAHALRIEKAKQRDELAAKLAEVREMRGRLAAMQASVAELPKTSDAAMESLRAAEKRCSNAAAALETIATGIEIVASEAAAFVGERRLAAGDSLILVEESELRIGDSIRIRIRPGGGTTLANARKEVSDAEAALSDQLARAGFASIAQFEKANGARKNLDVEMQTLRARLDASGADTIERAVEAAARACLDADTAARKLTAIAPELSIPSTFAEAGALLRESADALRAAEAQEEAVSGLRNRAVVNLRQAEVGVAKHRERVELERRAVSDLEAQVQVLIESQGGERQRTQAREELRVRRADAEDALRTTRSALGELRPEELLREQGRQKEAIARERTRESDAQQRRAVAWAALQRDGTGDPHGDLAVAQARLVAACERRAAVQGKAEAIRLLRQLFLAEQKEMADRFTRPLSAKISGYLERLFGPGAEAVMNLEANRFTALRLIRQEAEMGACDFGTLSGGTCEQVAAAVRLAMAELLSQTHDGSLPVVFDDAFGYADPERVRALQRMLDLGASRGLQIIVLTCNAADYAGFAAKEITLPSDAAADREASRAASVVEDAAMTS